MFSHLRSWRQSAGDPTRNEVSRHLRGQIKQFMLTSKGMEKFVTNCQPCTSGVVTGTKGDYRCPGRYGVKTSLRLCHLAPFTLVKATKDWGKKQSYYFPATTYFHHANGHEYVTF
ncbi:hypothetical protein AVEN_169704-1 [Araneus ventricosus]|uniref:Uncharacterized protein n=1 Tax=Araneus ventricosus TaxID=182803 RepID=A0A4Y2PA08_ARAVE|nr:hypothetical protein AVEN_113433-1 [Araneus ventricosus]GBN48242.1 hypothetical protein AVEN_169704-1 [Araneus ventricosus]